MTFKAKSSFAKGYSLLTLPLIGEESLLEERNGGRQCPHPFPRRIVYTENRKPETENRPYRPGASKKVR
jgi:hypothetical protein